MLLAIDPGKQGLAASLFDRNSYARGAVFTLPKAPLGVQCEQALASVRAFTGPDRVTAVAIEEMVYYPQAGSAKASSEIAALLRLQAIGAFVAAFYGVPTTFYPARAWKGQLPKEVCHARIRGLMGPMELFRLGQDAEKYGKKGHNLWDSAGIGLFHLGRFRP